MLLRFLIALMVSGAVLAGCDLYSSSQGRDEPLIIAHRGHNSLSDPENAIESLESLSPWVDGVEIDVRITADDVPVLIHDRMVDRTTSGTGRVSSYTLDELQALEAGAEANGGVTIPTLEDYLNAAAAFNFKLILIDMKNTSEHALNLTMDVLNRSPLKTISVIMVRSDEETARVRALSPDIRLGRFRVSEEIAQSAIDDLLEKQGEFVLTPPNRYEENVSVVEQAQAVGLNAGSSTNNDSESIQRALDDRVDIILTDIAGELGELVSGR